MVGLDLKRGVTRLRKAPWCFAGIAVITLVTTPVRAELHLATTTVPVHGTTPTTGFTATVTASGSATFSGGGSLNLGSVFGISLGTQGFSLPTQTIPIVVQGGPISVATNPSGNINVTYVNNPTNIAATKINSANINLLNGSSIPINFNPVHVNLDTSIIGIGISLGVDLDVAGQINSLIFNSSGPSPFLGSPNPTNPAFYGIPGTFDIGGNVTANGSTSILGINIGLGQLINQSINATGIDALSSIGGLPGIATLGATLTGTPGVANLNANFSFPNLGVSIPQSVAESGTISENYGNGSLGSLHDFHMNYSVNLNLTLSNISYNLTGGVPGAVVPEASTILMTGMAAIGTAGIGLRRRRRNK